MGEPGQVIIAVPRLCVCVSVCLSVGQEGTRTDPGDGRVVRRAISRTLILTPDLPS